MEKPQGQTWLDMSNCGIDDGEDVALNMKKKNLETKNWGELIGEWVQLRGETQVTWMKLMAGQEKLRKTLQN